MKQYTVKILVGHIMAEDEETAKEVAKEWLRELATSNDGSEKLANSKPIIEEDDS